MPPALQQPPALDGARAEERPNPPRYRQLKRWLVRGVVAVLLLVGVRLWWGYEASRRLTAEVAAIRARGEPILPPDFDTPDVPDSENAARAYAQAAGLLVTTASQTGIYQRYDGHLPLTPAEQVALESIVQANAAALAAARQARSLARRAVGVRVRSPAYTYMMAGLNADRALANVVAWDALYAHSVGDDEEAVAAASDLLGSAATRASGGPFLVATLVAVGVDALTLATLSQVAPDLAVEGDDAVGAASTAAATRLARPARRAEVLALIADLLDDAPIDAGFLRGFQADRMLALDLEPQVAREIPVALRFVVRPALQLDAARLVRWHAGNVDAARATNYPAAVARLQPRPRADGSRLAQLAHAYGAVLADGGETIWRMKYRELAMRRLTAVALAARLYRADHRGAWPASLGELLPAYLPSVPIDPFAADGRPVVYLPNAPAHVPAAPEWASAVARGVTPVDPGTGPFVAGPLVYSIGEDGTDDGGSRATRPDVRHGTMSYGWWDWQDIVLPLAPDARCRFPDPSTQPAPVPPPLPPDPADAERDPCARQVLPVPSAMPAGSGETQDHQPQKGDGGGKYQR